MIYPCMNCKKRYMGCHAKCEDYAKMQEETKESREAKREAERLNRIANDYSMRVIEKCRRMAHRRRG